MCIKSIQTALVKSFLLGKEPEIIENPGDGFCVAQLAAPDHLFQLLAVIGAGNTFLILFGFGNSGCQPFRQKDEHALLQKPWGGKAVQEDSKFPGAVPGFLAQLACGGLARAFARIDPARHQFPEILPRGMAILPNHQDTPVRQNGEHDDGAWVRNDFARCTHAAGLNDFVPANSEYFPLIDDLAAQNSCAARQFGGHGSSLITGGILAEDELKNTDGSVCYCNLLEPGGNRREHEQAEMPINTIIVDDEKPARDELAYLLKGFPEINVIGQGKNGVEAVALIKEHSPDLVFLDVQMPGLDGFGVLKKLVERKMKVPHVVFATAFDHYAVQAFDVNAVDYVLKPFDKGRISKAIQRARKVMETQTSPTERLEQLVSQLGASKQAAQPVKVLVKSQQRLLLVDAEDLIFASIEDG